MKLWIGIAAILLAGFFAAAEEVPTPATNQVVATNSAAHPAEEKKLQIWDAGDLLDFTIKQTFEVEKVHADHIAAEKLFRDGMQNTNLTAEQRMTIRKTYGRNIRDENSRINDILTKEQKAKFLEQKKAAMHAEKNDAAANAEYDALARKLRAQYSLPSTNWPKPTVDAGVDFVELGLLPEVKFPKDNPFSTNKAALGRMLFFDPRMSASRQIACASCHDPDLSWADGRTVGFGHERKELKRNVPTLLNAGLLEHLFWDGRANSLEAQVHDVLLNQDEMLGDESVIQERLEKMSGYRDAFKAAFSNETVSVTRIAEAVATFERTIVSRRSAFDEFLKGDTNALSDEAIRGLHLFRTSARCVNCHYGPTLSDGKFHNNGLSYYGRKYEDLGRYKITKKTEDVGAFKTPTLRNVTHTAPYMHNGLFELDGVLRLYNAGMPTLTRKDSQKDDPLFPTKSNLLQPLHLNAHELGDLKAFLESLEETKFRMRPPELPLEVAKAK